MLTAAAEAQSARNTNTRIVVFVATCLTFLLSIGVVDRNTHRLDETNQAVAHTYQTIGALDALLSTLKDAETGQRGYTITADSSFLQPYTDATTKVWKDFDAVKALTADNSTQQRRLEKLRPLVAQKLMVMDSIVRLSDVDADAAVRFIRTGRGRMAMEAVRASVTTMEDEERHLMATRSARSSKVVRQSVLVTLLAAALSIGMVVLLYRFVRRNERMQQRAADTIAAQRERLQITLTSIGDGVISTDADGNVTYLNQVAQSLTGWTNEEATGLPLTTIFNIINESTRLPVENPVMRALRDGRIVGLANHTILLARDGVERPIDDSAAPIRATDGTITGCVLIFRDISARYTAERRDREAQHEMSATLESISDAFMRIDGDWKMRYLNAEAERLFRLPVSDTIGESFWELFPEMRDSMLEKNFRRCADSRSPLDFEHHSTRWDRRFAIRCYPSRNGGLSVHMRDTTDVRRAESLIAALSEDSERQRRLFDTALSNTADFIYTFDRDGRYSYVNKAVEHFLGRPASDVVGRNSHDLIDDVALADKLTRQIAEVIETGTTLRDTTPYDGKFATAREYEYIFVPIFNAAGEVEAVAGSTRDITDRQQVERRLRESEADLDFALASADLGQWSFNLRDGSSRRTARHDEIFGYDSVLEWTYETFLAHVHPGERDAVDRAFQHAVATEGIWDIECTIRRADGVERQIWKTARIKRGSDGRLEKMLGIVGDVTEQRQVERERTRAELALRDADRRKDEFLATLAHELRNPLAPIRNGLEIIRIAGANASIIEQTRNMMDRQMKQMVRLVDDLLDVSRVTSGKLELQRERFDLQLMIDIAIETARPLIDSAGLTLTVQPLHEPIILDGDVTRLAQVISNLLSNSARYTPRGGSVALTIAREPGAVVLSVKDNGIGIPPSMLESIFGMFTQVDRRLEKVSGGLGLGLSLVKAIVDGHGGTAEARSDGDGLGSEFLIRLPIKDSSNHAAML